MGNNNRYRGGKGAGQQRRGQQGRKRLEEGDEIVVYGVHPVEEYLDLGGKVEQVWMSREKVPEALLERLERLSGEGVSVRGMSLDEMDEAIGGRGHQGVLIKGGSFDYAIWEDALEALPEEGVVLVLDQVQDVGNLGAILRSAAAFGVDLVVIPKDRAAGVTGAVIRASAGQALRVQVAQVVNVSRALEELKERGFWVVGTVLREGGSVAPWEVEMGRGKVALVLGGEHGGVRRLVGEQCDFAVEIPMAAGVESLNVASATSVMLYEVKRQRGGIKGK